jgi:hypothetical protein
MRIIRKNDPFTGAIYTILAAIMTVMTIVIVIHIAHGGTNLYQLTSKFFDRDDFLQLSRIPYPMGMLLALPILWILNSWSSRFRPDHWFWRWVVDFGPSVTLLAVIVFAIIKLFLDGQLSIDSDVSWLLFGLLVYALYDVRGHQKQNASEARVHVARLFIKDVEPVPSGNVAQPIVETTEVHRVLREKTFKEVGGQLVEVPEGDARVGDASSGRRVEFATTIVPTVYVENSDGSVSKI